MRAKQASAPGQQPIGGAEAREAEIAMRSGDLGPFRQLVAAPQTGGSWDDRDFFCELLAPKITRQALDAWCGGQGSQADLGLAHLARGRALIERAWEARGRGTADSVTEEGWQKMHERLQRAEQDLLRAAELDPTDPTPWAYLLTVAKGLNHDRATAEGWFQEAVRRDPTHYGAHTRMLSFLCEKWHGSHELMFSFARQAADNAPDGSDLITIVIDAHIERWLYFSFDEDEKGAGQYLKDPLAKQECLAAHQRSLGSPQLQVRRSTIYARNVAAMWFFLAREKRPLQMEIALIGNAYSTYPWCYWDEPERAYSEASKYAYGVL
jgi:hypothetical protein